MRYGKILTIVMTIALLAVPVLNKTDTMNVSADDIQLRFDLGGTPTDGITAVSASDEYQPERGWGFIGDGAENVEAGGSGALSDAVQFNDNDTVFCTDIPNGLYKVSVTLGKTDHTGIYMEDMLQIVNMTGNNAQDSVLVPVTDGQLNIRAAAGRKGPYTISEIDILKISDTPELPRTIWICGDSTVCNYYPIETSNQTGWGQVFDKFIDTSKWQVRDLASGSQYAKGFLTSGQFDTIEHYGREGDIYIISIGINDTLPKYSNEEEYYISVTEMTKRAKEKGMTVYLVKQQGKATDASDKDMKERWFGSTLDRIGEEQDVKVLDLFSLFHDYCLSIGQQATDELYVSNDPLHPNRKGAMILAQMISDMIDWDEFEEPAVLGEANGDGVLNVRDAACIALMLAKGKGDELAAQADFNEDGLINVRDAAAIAEYLAGSKTASLPSVSR